MATAASRTTGRTVVRLRTPWVAAGDAAWALGLLALLDFAIIRSVRWGDNLSVAMAIFIGSYVFHSWRRRK